MRAEVLRRAAARDFFTNNTPDRRPPLETSSQPRPPRSRFPPNQAPESARIELPSSMGAAAQVTREYRHDVPSHTDTARDVLAFPAPESAATREILAIRAQPLRTSSTFVRPWTPPVTSFEWTRVGRRLKGERRRKDNKRARPRTQRVAAETFRRDFEPLFALCFMALVAERRAPQVADTAVDVDDNDDDTTTPRSVQH